MVSYVGLPMGPSGVPVQAPIWDWANGQKVAITATSAQSAAINSTVVLIISDTNCFIKGGSAPVAADAADNARLPFDQFLVLGWLSGDLLAVIRDTVDGSLYLVPALEI